ncbi:MAG: hypothetical protein HFH24_01805 [Ruminococcus sp.]|nr:hypothetical protein [Ruminococcus sp.]
MLNYEEELRKFTPSLEVEGIEEAVYQEELPEQRQEGRKQAADRKK